MIIPPAEWLPDQPALNGGAGEALNVIPGPRSYRPFPAFSSYTTTPLTARCQGAAYARRTDLSACNVAGDATKLYLLSTLAWGNATRLVGGAYACGLEDAWDFAQFGPLFIAVDGTDAPQKFTIDSSTNFSLLGGTPPTGARFVEIMGDFVVMARTASGKRLVVWSALNNGEDYVASAATQADSQEIPDGGQITGLAGYEYGGFVLQENAIRRMDYEGSPIIFRFKLVSRGVGCSVEGSVASFGERTFLLHRTGFFSLHPDTGLEPIGAQKVDRYIWSQLDPAYLGRASSAVDPVNKVYGLLYCGPGSNGIPNAMVLYDWEVQRWTRVEPGMLDYIYSGVSQAAFTLDTLDTVSGSIDALAVTLDSPQWSGIPQPLFAGFNSTHNLGFFNGNNLAATIDSAEMQIFADDPANGQAGAAALVYSLRPLLDGGTPSLQVGTRKRQVDAPVFSAAVVLNALGTFRGRWRGRYHRGRVTIPASSTWTHFYGLDEVKARKVGGR